MPVILSRGYLRDFSVINVSSALQFLLVPFPIQRMRRLRSGEPIRRLVRETHLEASQFILPLFVTAGEGVRREISSMPGHCLLSIDQLVTACGEAVRLGLCGGIVFGLPGTQAA